MSHNATLLKAAKILNSGGVIAFPTDTVYGIGALLKQKSAIKRIYNIKNRPRKKPLQVLVASLQQAKKLGKFNKLALKMAKENWPGPLTLVIYKTRRVPALVTGSSRKVGLRIPRHLLLLKLLKACGPIAATSANFSGQPPALSVSAVKKSGLKIDYILPGRVKSRRASMVIDVTKKPNILRS